MDHRETPLSATVMPTANAANLTEFETLALSSDVNLSDGHPRQTPTETQTALFAGLGQLFVDVRQQDYATLERRAQRTFFDALGQRSAPVNEGRVRSFYSSSCAIDVLARCLLTRGPRIGLIHPTFDNIPDLLRSRGAELIALDDVPLLAGATDVRGLDVVFVTTPNNPTGAFADAQALRALAKACAVHGVFLSLDTSFRGFEPGAQYDMYSVLNETGVDYAVVEDTGKLWPALELKAGFLAYSADTALPFERATSDLLLSVSPVVLALITQLAEDAVAGGLDALHHLIAHNRTTLREALYEVDVEEMTSGARVSVALLRLPNGVSAHEVWRSLLAVDVHVLPGGEFFWNDARAGDRFIRVALARDPNVIQRGAQHLTKAVHALKL